ncbi:MAG: hypothetical protein HW416_3497 [Chloroflexi bacterium]|nr:hypothetical protein [Chloroflexota bacterium]
MPFFIQCLQPDQQPSAVPVRNVVFAKGAWESREQAEAAMRQAEQQLAQIPVPVPIPDPAFKIVEAESLQDAMALVTGLPPDVFRRGPERA